CMQEFKFEQNSKENNLIIPKGTLIKSKPIDKCVCEFKTVYDVYLYPISISEVLYLVKIKIITFNLTLQVNK
ncbi:type VI secretion system baseplate subunit TssF, partial [Campylobacter jejuni]|nr:type VI secretion system baseplate subunit TssF [Campylobacter jejuni]